MLGIKGYDYSLNLSLIELKDTNVLTTLRTEFTHQLSLYLRLYS